MNVIISITFIEFKEIKMYFKCVFENICMLLLTKEIKHMEKLIFYKNLIKSSFISNFGTNSFQFPI